MSLANLKSKYITLKHKVEKLEGDFKELNKKYDKVTIYVYFIINR